MLPSCSLPFYLSSNNRRHPFSLSSAERLGLLKTKERKWDISRPRKKYKTSLLLEHRFQSCHVHCPRGLWALLTTPGRSKVTHGCGPFSGSFCTSPGLLPMKRNKTSVQNLRDPSRDRPPFWWTDKWRACSREHMTSLLTSQYNKTPYNNNNSKRTYLSWAETYFWYFKCRNTYMIIIIMFICICSMPSLFLINLQEIELSAQPILKLRAGGRKFCTLELTHNLQRKLGQCTIYALCCRGTASLPTAFSQNW